MEPRKHDILAHSSQTVGVATRPEGTVLRAAPFYLPEVTTLGNAGVLHFPLNSTLMKLPAICEVGEIGIKPKLRNYFLAGLGHHFGGRPRRNFYFIIMLAK